MNVPRWILMTSLAITLTTVHGDFAQGRPPCLVTARAQVAATSVANVQAGIVAVPFAVPVAMPSYVQYSAVVQSVAPLYQAPVAAGAGAEVGRATMQSAACMSSRVDANRLPSDAYDSHAPSAAAIPSLVMHHCVRCHGATQPKAGLDLSGPLDDATRLKAIARVLADDPQLRMPKGRDLNAGELGRLIQELSTRSVISAGDSEKPRPANTID